MEILTLRPNIRTSTYYLILTTRATIEVTLFCQTFPTDEASLTEDYPMSLECQ